MGLAQAALVAQGMPCLAIRFHLRHGARMDAKPVENIGSLMDDVLTRTSHVVHGRPEYHSTHDPVRDKV